MASGIQRPLSQSFNANDWNKATQSTNKYAYPLLRKQPFKPETELSTRMGREKGGGRGEMHLQKKNLSGPGGLFIFKIWKLIYYILFCYNYIK
jgi:hypothetical protein